jgi:hypothetical protein
VRIKGCSASSSKKGSALKAGRCARTSQPNQSTCCARWGGLGCWFELRPPAAAHTDDVFPGIYCTAGGHRSNTHPEPADCVFAPQPFRLIGLAPAADCKAGGQNYSSSAKSMQPVSCVAPKKHSPLTRLRLTTGVTSQNIRVIRAESV